MKGGHITAGYAAIAITLILGLGVTLVGVKEHPLTVSPPAVDWRAFFKRFWIDPRLYPDFAWVWVTRALVTLGIWFVEPQIQYYLEDVVHVKNPGQTAGYLLGTMLIGATITGVLGGKLSDTIGRKKVVYIANGTTAVMAVAFCFGHTLAYTFVVGLIFGLGFGAYYSVDWALGCDVLPNKEDAAKDMGIWHISMVLPQSFAPALAAAILSAFPHHLSSGPSGQVVHYSLAGYIALFCLTALFLTLGAVFLRNVRGVR